VIVPACKGRCSHRLGVLLNRWVIGEDLCLAVEVDVLYSDLIKYVNQVLVEERLGRFLLLGQAVEEPVERGRLQRLVQALSPQPGDVLHLIYFFGRRAAETRASPFGYLSRRYNNTTFFDEARLID